MADYSDAYGPFNENRYTASELQKARADGKDAGYKVGYNKGFDDGFAEGWKEAETKFRAMPVISSDTPPRCPKCQSYMWEDQEHTCQR